LLTTYAKDIAESLNITIPENVASSLASDVEYRINQLIEVTFGAKTLCLYLTHFH